jgi:hypothetical protein
MESPNFPWGFISCSVTADLDRVRQYHRGLDAGPDFAGRALDASIRRIVGAMEKAKGSPDDSTLHAGPVGARRIADDGTLFVEVAVTREPMEHEARTFLEALEGHGFKPVAGTWKVEPYRPLGFA